MVVIFLWHASYVRYFDTFHRDKFRADACNAAPFCYTRLSHYTHSIAPRRFNGINRVEPNTLQVRRARAGRNVNSCRRGKRSARKRKLVDDTSRVPPSANNTTVRRYHATARSRLIICDLSAECPCAGCSDETIVRIKHDGQGRIGPLLKLKKKKVGLNMHYDGSEFMISAGKNRIEKSAEKPWPGWAREKTLTTFCICHITMQ